MLFSHESVFCQFNSQAEPQDLKGVEEKPFLLLTSLCPSLEAGLHGPSGALELPVGFHRCGPFHEIRGREKGSSGVFISLPGRMTQSKIMTNPQLTSLSPFPSRLSDGGSSALWPTQLLTSVPGVPCHPTHKFVMSAL